MSWYHDGKMNDQIRIARHRLPSSDPVFNDSVSMGFTSLQGDGHFAFFVDIRRCYFCTQDVWNESVGLCDGICSNDPMPSIDQPCHTGKGIPHQMECFDHLRMIAVTHSPNPLLSCSRAIKLLTEPA